MIDTLRNSSSGRPMSVASNAPKPSPEPRATRSTSSSVRPAAAARLAYVAHRLPLCASQAVRKIRIVRWRGDRVDSPVT